MEFFNYAFWDYYYTSTDSDDYVTGGETNFPGYWFETLYHIAGKFDRGLNLMNLQLMMLESN